MGSWKFDETAGTIAADCSGNNNSGIVSGATWNPSGLVCGSLNFASDKAHVTIPNRSSLNFATNRITIACWVYPTNLSGEFATIVQRSNASNSWFNWQIYATAKDASTPGRPVFRMNWNGNSSNEASEEVQGDVSLTLNQWNHIACTYDGTALRFYLNGTLRNSTAKIGGIIPNSGHAIWIGANEAWGEPFCGQIDEVRLYDRALGAAEIQALTTDGNEIQFMERMIDQFSMCVQYADVAATQATSSELRAFAQNCSSRQQAEIQMMQEWLLTWFNVIYTPHPDSDFSGRLATFKTQLGNAFDTQFMGSTISYENQELYLAQQAASFVSHTDLKSLAIDIIQLNTDELKTLNDWLNK